VINTDTRFILPGGEVAHGAQDVRHQFDVLGVVGGAAGIVIVVLSTLIVTHIEAQPADELGQLSVSRHGALLKLCGCRLGQPLHQLPMPDGALQGELRAEHISLLPEIGNHASSTATAIWSLSALTVCMPITSLAGMLWQR
jgi:hypothetical protein